MGHRPSKYDNVKIVLDKYIGQIGENITGTIQLTLVKPFPKANLILHFKGIERTRWEEGSGDSKHTVKGSNKITKATYLLNSWPETIQPGYFAIPFDFTTPASVPPSFQYRSKKGVAVVEYYFKAGLSRKKNLQLKDKQNIYLYGIDRFEILPTWPISCSVKKCCCLSRGIFTMNLKWVNITYSQGNPIECFLEVDASRSQVGVKAIIAEIYYVMNLNNGNGKSAVIREKLVSNKHCVKIEKGAVLHGDSGIKFSLDIGKVPKPIEAYNIHTSNSSLIVCGFYVDFILKPEGSGMCGGAKAIYTCTFFVKPAVFIEVPERPSMRLGYNYYVEDPGYIPPDEILGEDENQRLLQFSK